MLKTEMPPSIPWRAPGFMGWETRTSQQRRWPEAVMREEKGLGNRPEPRAHPRRSERPSPSEGREGFQWP